MRKTILLVLILIILCCQNKKSENPQNTESNREMELIEPKKLVLNDTVVYLSGDNDLALIKLTLIPNGTFDFYMSIYPKPMQDADPKSDIINSNGTWSGEEKTVSLNFVKRKKDTLNLNDLFDSNYKQGDEFKVIDQNTVEIN
ncbi:MAG: hypothetical protein AAF554_02235 [Bacteroidota bacterium]